MSAVIQDQPIWRQMLETDLPQIVLIEQQAHLTPWSAGIFSDCLRVGYVSRLLQVDQQIVAYGIMSVAAGEAHIFNLCVAPENQRQGYGRQMLKHLMQIAIERKAQSIFLEVRPSNQKAIALYRDAGFDEVGVRKNYYPAKKGREDALILAKEL
ncbi:MAG: ribosomal protein S18-alanine N-acetyltransferase [Gammaproteobacteria bacterium]|nr:ribosomal protein S18-alanine N-acetyltransferase [Gammaproteobacteria bacterium]MDH5728929.1 ribosomal protein S18-alanine N-acetyltransferase [Gammaproteobacteria bacterium]